MLSQGRAGSAAAMKGARKSLEKFMNGRGLDINDISSRLLTDWQAWIQREAKTGKRYTGESASWAYLVQARTAFNCAKREYNDEDAGLMLIPRSPFSKLERPECVMLGAGHKRALSLAELIRVLRVPTRSGWAKGNTDFNLARDCFALSFLLLGMNPADLYDCTEIVDGRIVYQRVKTRRRRVDNAEMSVRIEPEAAALVERYRDPTGARVFSFHTRYSSAKSFYNALNRGMHLLGDATELPNLQFYAARHTWATLAANAAGVDKYTVHEALNHVDPLMRITDVYIRRDWRRVDEAARAVLALLPSDLPWS